MLGHMDYVRAEAVRRTDHAFPGWVEVHLRTADRGVVAIVDKAPVLGVPDDAGLPMAVELPCDVLSRPTTRSALVRLRAGLEDDGGRAIFHVSEDEIVPADG